MFKSGKKIFEGIFGALLLRLRGLDFGVFGEELEMGREIESLSLI